MAYINRQQYREKIIDYFKGNPYPFGLNSTIKVLNSIKDRKALKDIYAMTQDKAYGEATDIHPASSLMGMFVFSKSKLGVDYWYTLYLKIK